jgi:hypothetical protein
MSSVYRETISDARLKAVADHVRAWLFPLPKEGNPKPEDAGPAQSEKPADLVAAAVPRQDDGATKAG